MANSSVEARLEALEAEVARLKEQLQGSHRNDSWKSIIGTFDNDPAYEKAMKLGRQYRESQRPKSRKKSTKRDGSA